MHDSMENTPEVLEKVIEKALEMEYTFVPMDELWDIKAYRS